MTARKPHVCPSCRRTIEPGEQYYRGASLCLDDFPPRRVETIVCCQRCAAGDDEMPPFIPPRFVVYRVKIQLACDGDGCESMFAWHSSAEDYLGAIREAARSHGWMSCPDDSGVWRDYCPNHVDDFFPLPPTP